MRRGGARGVGYAGTSEEAIGRLVGEAREGDAIVTLGAGSVSQLGRSLLMALEGVAVSAGVETVSS